MEKINILFVLDQLTIGTGVSAMVLDYYWHIDREKFKIDFIVSKQVEPVLEKKIVKNGSEIYYFPALKLRNLIAYKKKWKKFLKEHTQYKILHAHIPVMAFIYMKMAKKYEIPVRILHAHNARGSDRWYKRIRNRCFYFIGVKASNQYAACSKKAAEFLFGRKTVKQNKVKLIKNAIVIEEFSYSEKERNRIRKEYQLENKFVIGHVGRFSPQKNHMFLIKVFAEYQKKHNNAVLLLIGEGKEKETVKRQVEKEHIKDEVLFLKATKEVSSFYQAMDVFLLPSKFEGLPIVCIEAQAAGLLCLVSDKVDKEVILTPNIECLSIEHGTKIWTEALKRTEEGKERQRTLESLKEKGYDIKIEVKHLERFYLQCLEKELLKKKK